MSEAFPWGWFSAGFVSDLKPGAAMPATVKGDKLRCHFHGFCFDAKGACTRTGYGTKAPPRARVRSYPVVDFGGVLAVWYDPEGRAPLWTPEFPDRAGWGAPLRNTWVFEGRPQEIAEIGAGGMVRPRLTQVSR